VSEKDLLAALQIKPVDDAIKTPKSIEPSAEL
jgi:hypothetical protein